MNIVDFPEWMEKTTQLEINTTIILKLYASWHQLCLYFYIILGAHYASSYCDLTPFTCHLYGGTNLTLCIFVNIS